MSADNPMTDEWLSELPDDLFLFSEAEEIATVREVKEMCRSGLPETWNAWFRIDTRERVICDIEEEVL